MSGAGALNLSLLSRGVGEVQKNGHEKVEVFLEPSDYLNFGADRPYYLPPLTNTYHFPDGSPRLTARPAREAEIPLPKTFTTRKGALLLFSEDMALKTQERHEKHARRRHHPMHSSFTTHSSVEDETAMVLKTVDDLAKSILRYGSRDFDEDHDKMYLKFLHRRREQWERQIRPGYSAKRYLSTWTRTWDDQVFETVVSKGYLTERSLFHYNLFMPNLRRHLFHEDLSNMPQPYRLMKNMLLIPGSLSGYTFYRTPAGREFGALLEEEGEEGEFPTTKRPDTMRSIRVIRTTNDGQQKEVSYSTLDKETQREVITDLLVKSAVHYALSKQEEIIEESIAHAMKSDQVGVATSYVLTDSRQTKRGQKSVPGFDMREAVDSLLDTHRGPFQLGADLPDFDAHSHTSEHTGSFKGGALSQHGVKGTGVSHAPRGSWPVGLEEASGKEYMGGVSVGSFRDLSASSSSISSVPQLPPIKAPLSPIKDVSRETSQLVTLPPIHKDAVDTSSKDGGTMPTVHVMPPTPQQSSLALIAPRAPVSPRTGADLHHIAEAEPTVAEVSGYHISNESSPSIQGKSTGRQSKTKGQPPRSMVAGSHESRSLKGSMIMAPDGEIISVGGSVIPPRPVDVGIISDVAGHHHVHDPNMTDESGMSDDEPDEWRRKPRTLSSKKSDSLKKHRKASQRSSITEQEILDTLTEHAKCIANSVLSHDRAGQDLETDVRDAIQDIMKTQQRSNSAGPSAAEYKNLIRQSLTTAVARAAGLDPNQFPEDAEISPDLLEALVNQQLTPDDIAIIRDEETGRPVIKSRAEINQMMGGVADGHLYMAPNGKGSIAGNTIADLTEHPAIPAAVAGGQSPDEGDDAFKKAVQQVTKEGDASSITTKTPSAADGAEGQEPRPPGSLAGDANLEQDAHSEKSGKSHKSAESEDVKKGKGKEKSPDEKEEPFVVGLVDHKDELKRLYGGQLPQLPKTEAKSPVKAKPKGKKEVDRKGKGKMKGKGKKGKKEEEAAPKVEPEPPAPPAPVEEKEPEPPVVQPATPKQPTTAGSSDKPFQSSPELKTEDEMDFNIIREEFSPEPEKHRLTPEEDLDDDEEPELDDDGRIKKDDANLISISNREARAAKRAAAAAKRKEEVERRRREREEQVKREKEEQERQEQLRREMEEERKRREEERRKRKEMEAEEKSREEQEMEEAERRNRLEQDREKRAKEDYMRKLDEMKKQQQEEEAKRMELLLQKQKEEEERRAEEELLMSQMAEQERLEYEKKKKEEEEARKKKEEEERLNRELEAKLAMEEARRLAEEMARKQAELEARLKFNRALQVEASSLDHSQDINRAFIFSYYELLQWLGLDIPEFELAKMSQF